MNNWSLLMSKVRTLGWILTMGVSMNACSATTMTWKEEVLLHDGKKLVVERLFHLGGYPTIESRERQALDETVEFTHPKTNQTIIWKSDFRDDTPDQNGLNLLVLDIVKGIPYIATYPAGCIAFNKWKRPNPPYIVFKYEGNEWRRIPLEMFPTELGRTNVIVGKPPAEFLKPYYTVEGVNERNRDSDIEFKTILRTAYPAAAGGCPEMVYDGHGGWLGIDWFTMQPTYEACLDVCKRNEMSPQHCPCNRLFKGGK
jgi:hypothetical protein